jgi:hypothetical protein
MVYLCIPARGRLKEIAMHLVVERPYPVDYIHPNGEQAKIDFIWGDPKSMAPIGITIWLRAGNDSVKLGEEMGEWRTFGEALRHGINLAFTWLSR